MLQLPENNTCLFVLVFILKKAVEQEGDGMNDLRGVIGGCTEFDRVVGIILRLVFAVSVSRLK